MTPPLNIVISFSNLVNIDILSCFADFVTLLHHNEPLAIHEPIYGTCRWTNEKRAVAGRASGLPALANF